MDKYNEFLRKGHDFLILNSNVQSILTLFFTTANMKNKIREFHTIAPFLPFFILILQNNINQIIISV